MDEHHGTRKGATFLKGVPEEEVIVMFETHTTQNDDVDLGLQGDTRQQLVVGLTGAGKDG